MNGAALEGEIMLFAKIAIFVVSFGAFIATAKIMYEINHVSNDLLHGLINWIPSLSIGAATAFILFQVFVVKKSPLNILSDMVSTVQNATDSVLSTINEKDAPYYAIAEQEINEGKRDEGLWSQALVKAEGNENKRKTEYIKMRVKQLKRTTNI